MPVSYVPVARERATRVRDCRACQVRALLLEAVAVPVPSGGSLLDLLPGEIEEPLRAWLNGEPFAGLWENR